MVKLTNRIKDLQKETGSLTVTQLCEKAQAKLSEINEMNITREANEELENSIIEGLLKDLKNENDEAARNFVVREERFFGIRNLGVKTAISAIKESDISSHPALSYAIAQFEKLKGQPEYLIAENFYSRLNAFNWHPVVKESLTTIKENATKYKEDIIIHKAIYELKNSRSAYILSGIRESLDDYVLNRTKTSKARLVEKLNKFTFDPLVRNLANAIRESHDNSLEVKTSKAGTEVERIFSPVIINEDSEIFAVGTDVYEKKGSELTKLSEQEINNLDPAFTQLVQFIASPNVRISEGLVTVYARNKKIEITNESIAVNGKTVTREDFEKIYMNAGVFRREELSTMGAISQIAENFNNIVEIEFAKRFRTPLVGNRRVDVIKIDENIFVTKEDPQMGRLDFFRNLNATQTRSIVLEFMNYDIYETFGAQIAEDEAKLKAISESKKAYIQTISQLEEKLSELNAIDDEHVKESNEFKNIVKSLEDEINGLKEEYANFVAKAHEITNIPEVSESELEGAAEDVTSEFKADMRVHCKMHDMDGTVTGSNDTTGKITVLLDNGETCECESSDLEVIDADVTGVKESEIEIKVDGKKIEIESGEEEEEEDEDKEGKSKDSEDDEDDDKLELENSNESDDPVSAIAAELAKRNKLSEDHAQTEKPAESTSEFKASDRVETKDERYGTVQGVNDITGKVTVAFDDGETAELEPSELVIVEETGIDEGAGAGDEVELEDGRRAMVQGQNDSTGELTVITDDGESLSVDQEKVKLVSDLSSQQEGAEEVEGKQSDGDSVDTKE